MGDLDDIMTTVWPNKSPAPRSNIGIHVRWHDVMNTHQIVRLDAPIVAKLVFGILLFIAVSLMFTGCIGPEITDPDWRGRDVYNTMPPTTPPPPRQWDYRTWDMSN